MTLSLPMPRTPDPASAPPVRWGILATGWIASAMAQAMLAHTRQQIVACASRSADRSAAFAERFHVPTAYNSYEALVADPRVEAVYVASPHSEHYVHAKLALTAGKHVLVEKAFTQNAAQARELAELAQLHGVVLMEAMWTRFLPRHDIVRQLLAAGALGELETVVADHGQYMEFDPAGRMYNPDLAGGALLDLGIYPISFARFVLGAPGSVQAQGTLTSTGVDRQASVILDGFPQSSAHAVLTTTLAAKTPTTAVISGSQARIELDGDFYGPGPVRLVSRDGSSATSAPEPIRRHYGLCYEAAHFASLIREGQTESPLLPRAETVAIMETLDKIRAHIGVRYPGE
ncbi:MAG: Gfo/Idh/MocA family protein [Propioniciclava sp.]